MKVILLFGLIGLVYCWTEEEYRSQFLEFVKKYERTYSDEIEMEKRYNIFKNAVDIIDAHNSKPRETYWLGMNQFGDVTKEEYLQMASDFVPPTSWRVSDEFWNEDARNAKMPTNFDWRDQGAVTPIQNQGDCGSSPFFAAVASIEGCHKIGTGNLVALSVQNIIDCPGNTGNYGCGGGYMWWAFEVVMEEDGIDTNSCYPYVGETQNCSYNSNPSCCGSRVGSYVNVTSGSELALQMGVLQAPVATAVNPDPTTFMYYKGGVYSDPSCGNTTVEHGIAVIGYGVDTASQQDYWILKNSWGTSWGIEGYMWLARNDGDLCGVAIYPSYTINCGNCENDIAF